MPKISVCIPTYNCARYLREAIDSVLQQEFDDYELVICDNASTDDTPEICHSFDDAHVRYVRFQERTNQAGNFNRCLNEATGEYLTLLHADDFLLPGFLADRAKSFEDDPDLGFVFGAVVIVDADGIAASIRNRWPEDRTFKTGELLDSLLFGCIVSPPSLMVRKSCADKAGLFRTDLTWGHDWEWTLRLAEQFAARYTSNPLAAYRVHAESGTAEQLNRAENGRQERRILKAALARLEVSDDRFRQLRRPALRALSHRLIYFAEQALLSGRKHVARNNLWYAAKSDLKALTRPTFWAILAASGGSSNWYVRYRGVRNAVVSSGSNVWPN
jgi:glycosyltransferase involved in cell wall biosynthesis